MPIPAGFVQIQQAQGMSWGDPGSNEQQAVYFQNGGFVVENLIDKGGAVYNVKAYGARGDGVTNDSASINNTIAAAVAAGGGVVQIPLGTFVANIVATNMGAVRLVGAGDGTIISPPSGIGLDITGLSNGAVSDLQIKGGATGIRISGGAGRFTRIRCVDQTTVGIKVLGDAGLNHIFRDTSISRVSSGTLATGFDVERTTATDTGAIIADNLSVGAVSPGVITTGYLFNATQAVFGGLFMNKCVADNITGTALSITNMSSFWVSQSWFVSASGSTSDAITISAGTEFIFMSNHVVPQSGQAAFAFTSAPSMVVLVGNYSASGTFMRMPASNPPVNITILGNRIGSALTNDYGLLAAGTDASDMLGHVVWTHGGSGTGQTFALKNANTNTSFAKFMRINGVNSLEIFNSGFSSIIATLADAGTLGVAAQLFPGAEGVGTQNSGGILHATGVPSNSNGNNNDWCISDNGHLYFKSAGSWAQKV